jgi:excisionase family DNA binding protein
MFRIHPHAANLTARRVPTLRAGLSQKESQVNEVTGSGDVYTMAEAARLKGVSYHTVSRAVRRGKLPATRLGRMALITSEDLREWRPMRERAPRKYRRREPNPEATPALLDLASAERVELASRLASLYEALHTATDPSPSEDFFGLVADRLAGTLGLRRVAIRILDEPGRKTVRVASYGSPLTALPDETSLEGSPLSLDVSRPQRAVVEELSERDIREGAVINATSLLIVPIRVDGRFVGAIVGDKNGEPFRLNQGELDFAQSMANIAALSLSRVRAPLTAGVA